MKKIYLLLITLVMAASMNAQSSASYTFATGTSATFTDMTSGTTQMVGASTDDAAGANTAIGFDFWLMGNRYIQFNATSNGFVGLSATGTAVGNTVYSIAGGTATTPIIASCGGDLVTGPAGKVHYKVIGSAPNRVLVVEFLNMSIVYNGTTNDGTSQVRLYETTGVIECVYGSMNRNSQTGIDGNAGQLGIGFSTAAANNFLVSIVSATNTSSVTNPFTQQLYPLSTPIANLNTPVEGSRRIYSMTPPVPNDPTALTFTAVTVTGMTLNWVDNSSNETGFIIYRSTDAVNYSFITKTAANTISSVQGGLIPSTTYYWRVVAVSEGGMSNILSGSQATNAAGNITSNGTGGGLWSATTTWVGGVVPTSSDNVTILNADVVTIDIAANSYSLIVGQGTTGVLQYEPTTARTLTVQSDVTVSSGGTFRSAVSGTVTTHVLSLAGNLTNNGTLDFSTNANTAGAGITFTGAANNSFGGSGATTDIRTMTINKGTSSANILELNPTNFTVQGTTTDGAPMAFLTLTNGTLKASGAFTLTGRVFTPAAYTIPATGGLWINNPNFTVAGQNGSPTTNGLLRITQGTYNIGTASGNSMGFSSGSTIIVEGGTVNATGRFGVAAAGNAITYTQTGTAVITVCTIGNGSATLASFDLGTSLSSTINMSGGTIVCQLAATGLIDYRNQAGTGIFAVTGGTLQCGNASSGAAKTFNLRGVMPNLVVDNTSAGHIAQMSTTLLNYNNISLNITINTGTTFNAGNVVFLFDGTVLTNNGTLTHNGASSNFVTFLTTAPQLYTGTGTVTAPITNFAIQSDMGLTINPASANIVVSAIRLFSGSLINSNKITLGNGGATTGIVQIGNTTIPTAAGTFDVPFTFNLGTGGQTLSYLRTTLSRSTGPEINPARILTTLTVDDNDATHVLTLAGGNLAVSFGATPTFTFTNGKINLAGNTLTLGLNATTAALAGTMTTGATTAYMYNGFYKRWISATTGNRDFPMGVAAFKRNASINFTTAPGTGGSLTAEWVSSPGGSNGLPLVEPVGPITVTKTSNEGYWKVAAADGLTGGNYTGTFTATGIMNVVDVTQLVLLKRADPSAPWTLNGTHVVGSGTPAAPVLSRTGMGGFSDFGIGSSNTNPLPISLLSFSGYKDGSRNQLRWTTSSEQNNSGFEVQRSTDGINYSALGFVNSQAVGGNSTIQLNYTFTDNNVTGDRQYYRLRMVDFSGNSKFSNIVLIKGDKPLIVMIDGLFPNPASELVNLLIASPNKDKLTLIITDVAGQTMIRQELNVGAGSSTIPVDISRLANGTYMVKLVCSSNCEAAVGKFVKQ